MSTIFGSMLLPTDRVFINHQWTNYCPCDTLHVLRQDVFVCVYHIPFPLGIIIHGGTSVPSLYLVQTINKKQDVWLDILYNSLELSFVYDVK